MNYYTIKNPSVLKYFTILYLLLFLVFESCYTSNNCYTFSSVAPEKLTHSAYINTSFPFPGVPQNIGFNYQISTPPVTVFKINCNAYVANQMPLRNVIVSPTIFHASNNALRATEYKALLMPSIQLSNIIRFGVGFGFKRITNVQAPPIDTNGGFILNPHRINLLNSCANLAITLRERENKISYLNIGFTLTNKLDKRYYISHYEYIHDNLILPPSYEKIIFDLSTVFLNQNYYIMFIKERKLSVNNLYGVFKIGIGFSHIGSNIFSSNVNDDDIQISNSEILQNNFFKGATCPMTISYGLRF